MLAGVDQRRTGSPFEAYFLSRFLPVALREFFLAAVTLGFLTCALVFCNAAL